MGLMTPTKRRRAPLACLASTLLLAGACAPARMAVPPDIGTASDEIDIADRSSMSGALVNESFKMGPYQVVNVDRKWESSSKSSFLGLSSGSSRGGYAFALKAPEGNYQGQCASELDEKAVGVLGVSVGNDNYLVHCACSGASKVSLMMNADNASHYRGTVTAPDGSSYQLAGIYTDEKGSAVSHPIGFDIRGAGPVGAVEVVGKGRVWMNRSLAPAVRADLACLFAGLLLYQPPRKKLDN
jgi:hypothetical protein